jgi:hypothetical protein
MMLSPVRRSLISRLARSSSRWELSTRTFHQTPIHNEASQAATESSLDTAVLGTNLTFKTSSGRQRKLSEKERRSIERVARKYAEKQRDSQTNRKSSESGSSTGKPKQTRHESKLSSDQREWFDTDIYSRYEVPHTSELPDLKKTRDRGHIEWDGEGQPDVRWRDDPIRYLELLQLTLNFTTEETKDGTYRSKIVLSKHDKSSPSDKRRSKDKGEGAAEKLWSFWAHSEVEAIGDGRTKVFPEIQTLMI